MKAITPLLVGILFSLSRAYDPDIVTSLPEMGDFPSAVYSGYLGIFSTSKNLHYMFVESQNDPANDPVVIWFNGGPGCSSMLGFLQEHGPYVMEDNTTTFHLNDFSWSKEANMLYIESPAGVGYSYCINQKDCNFDDMSSSEDNLGAVLDFFFKYPQYGSNDLYISGESYAGVYVPYLAYQIDKWNDDMSTPANARLNLKGIMVGNGVTNWQWDGDTSYVEIAFYHGLYGTTLRNKIKDNNCNFYYEDITPVDSPECAAIYSEFNELVSKTNVYDMYRPCFFPDATHLKDSIGQVQIGDEIKTYKRHYTTKDYTPWLYEKVLKDSSLPPCIFGVPIVDYLNQEDVRTKLHIPTQVQGWEMCTSAIGYESGYNASEWIYPILRGKYRILFYSGNTDGSVPTRGAIQWMNQMGWEILEAQRPFYLNGQVAGYVEQRDGLTFGTIHGCGHMAPQWKRAETYHLIFNWLQKKDI